MVLELIFNRATHHLLRIPIDAETDPSFYNQSVTKKKKKKKAVPARGFLRKRDSTSMPPQHSPRHKKNILYSLFSISSLNLVSSPCALASINCPRRTRCKVSAVESVVYTWKGPMFSPTVPGRTKLVLGRGDDAPTQGLTRPRG